MAVTVATSEREPTPMSQAITQWEHELAANGWKYVQLGVYAAPCGCIYRGPYGAWEAMLQRQAMNYECPRPHNEERKFLATKGITLP